MVSVACLIGRGLGANPRELVVFGVLCCEALEGFKLGVDDRKRREMTLFKATIVILVRLHR